MLRLELMELHADVLIVTVTKVESQAVLRAFQGGTQQKGQPISIGERVYHDLGVVNGARVVMAISEMGAGGLGASQQAVQKGISALRPSAVLLLGTSFGINPQEQAIGDVLVSRQLALYDLQRVGTNTIIPRGDRPHASPRLINYLQSAELGWETAKVHFGLVLSGAKLVDSIDYRSQLQEIEPEALGGEMEGGGLYVACQDAKIDWILVKGICNWADGSKTQDQDARHQKAADNAAAFVLHALLHTPLLFTQSKTPGLVIRRTNPLLLGSATMLLILVLVIRPWNYSTKKLYVPNKTNLSYPEKKIDIPAELISGGKTASAEFTIEIDQDPAIPENPSIKEKLGQKYNLIIRAGSSEIVNKIPSDAKFKLQHHADPKSKKDILSIEVSKGGIVYYQSDIVFVKPFVWEHVEPQFYRVWDRVLQALDDAVHGRRPKIEPFSKRGKPAVKPIAHSKRYLMLVRGISGTSEVEQGILDQSSEILKAILSQNPEIMTDISQFPSFKENPEEFASLLKKRNLEGYGISLRISRLDKKVGFLGDKRKYFGCEVNLQIFAEILERSAIIAGGEGLSLVQEGIGQEVSESHKIAVVNEALKDAIQQAIKRLIVRLKERNGKLKARD